MIISNNSDLWRSDPEQIFNSGSAGFFSYVGNDPVNFIDPSGLYCLSQKAISLIASLGGAAVSGFITGGPAGALAAIAVAGATALVTSYAGGDAQTSAGIGAAAGGVSIGGNKTSLSVGGVVGGLAASGGGDSSAGRIGAATLGGALGSLASSGAGESKWGGGHKVLANAAKAAKGVFFGAFFQEAAESLLNKYNDCEEDCS